MGNTFVLFDVIYGNLSEASSPWRNRSQTKCSSPWATAICPCVKSPVIKCWCNSKSIAEPTFVIFSCFCLKFFRNVHTNLHCTFLKRPKYNFYPDWCGQGLSLFPTGERFQDNVVLVTRFTGFVKTELRPIRVKKVRGLKNFRTHVDVASINTIQKDF